MAGLTNGPTVGQSLSQSDWISSFGASARPSVRGLCSVGWPVQPVQSGWGGPVGAAGPVLTSRPTDECPTNRATRPTEPTCRPMGRFGEGRTEEQGGEGVQWMRFAACPRGRTRVNERSTQARPGVHMQQCAAVLTAVGIIRLSSMGSSGRLGGGSEGLGGGGAVGWTPPLRIP